MITVPSYNLIFDQASHHRPWVKLLAVGSQWFWSYQLTSSLSQALIDSYLVRSAQLRSGQIRVLEPDCNLLLPINRCMRLLLSSVAVIHSFGIHSLALKLDCIPGRLSGSYFVLVRTGIFRGACMELCGLFHAHMPVKIHSICLSAYLIPSTEIRSSPKP